MERRKVLYRSAAAATAAGVLGLCGAGIWKLNQPEASGILAGVPAQVEDTTIVQGSCVAQVGMVCAKYDQEYRLTVEQCPDQDLANARQGIPVSSYDRRIGHYGAACVVATIVVPQALYESSYRGDVVFPPGKLGEPVARA